MYSYRILPKEIKARIEEKIEELVDAGPWRFQTYGLHEDPYHVMNWCVVTNLRERKAFKVSLGPRYLGIVRDDCQRADLKRVLTRLYCITDYITHAEELERLLLLASVHSVTVMGDESVDTPYIASISTAPWYDFNTTRIAIKVKRYDVLKLRELVAGNYRGELLHGALYALLGHTGEGKYTYTSNSGYTAVREYPFTRWLHQLGIRSGSEAIFALNNWRQFFLIEAIDGTDFLFGIPHSAVPDNNQLFTRRALDLHSGQLVEEGTLKDMRVFTQILNLYLAEKVPKWASSSGKLKRQCSNRKESVYSEVHLGSF